MLTCQASILSIHGDTSRLYNFAATMAERTFGAEKLLEAANRMSLAPGVMEGLREYYGSQVSVVTLCVSVVTLCVETRASLQQCLFECLCG